MMLNLMGAGLRFGLRYPQHKELLCSISLYDLEPHHIWIDK